jgi:hypothetical protein
MCLDEWKQDPQVVTIEGNANVGERIDEYGDWEVACGGQKKVLKASLK